SGPPRGYGSVVVGHDELHVPRRLPHGTFAEVRHLVAGRALVARVDVDDRLGGEQVEDGEARLQVHALDRQRPGHVGTDVVDPRHATERAALAIDEFTGGVVAATRHAQPARTAAAELAGAAGAAVVVGPTHAE